MSTPVSAAATNIFGRKMGARTLTGLKRWSCQDKELPPIQQIKAIHVYDFDNTLFSTPMPNHNLWNGETIARLKEKQAFANGGWWHDSRILAATGEGLEKEEMKAYEGWWNEQIVALVKLSMKQKDTLTVLLTGRAQTGFAELIKRIVASKKLEFDIISLKPQVSPESRALTSTMLFKQMFLEDLMYTYKEAEEIRMYEDRPRHTKQFREFFTSFNKRQMDGGSQPHRNTIFAEVVQVAEGTMFLDPVTEVAEVQRIVNDHNLAVTRRGTNSAERLQIKRTVFYTGYLIAPAMTEKLLSLVPLPSATPDGEVKFFANKILITPRPAGPSILGRTGGMGSEMTWEVEGTGHFENKIWAARVRPVPADAKYYTENKEPIIVLAHRKTARPMDASKIQNWQPVPREKSYRFETTVGEKVLLRIENENPNESEWDSQFLAKNPRRKHPQEHEAPPTGPADRSGDNGNALRQQHYQQQRNRGGRGGRGGSSNYRGNPRSGGGGGAGGGGGRGRGRGWVAGYKSLDDVSEPGYQETFQPHRNEEYRGLYHTHGAGPRGGGYGGAQTGWYARDPPGYGY